MDKPTVLEILRQLIPDKIYESGKNLNFRCPLCGDSKKSKIKRRGWVLFKDDRVTYYCHNCETSISFQHFVNELNVSVYNKYFRNKDIKKATEKIQNVEAKLIGTVNEQVKDIRLNMPEDLSGDILPDSFPLLKRDLKSQVLKELQYKALREVILRGIPKKYYSRFLVCYEENDEENKNFLHRLIIPYYDKNDVMYCFQGRALFDGMIPKYKTWNKNNTKIFNYFLADRNEVVNVTEGPIDAMFLRNGVSTSGTIKFEGAIYNELIKKFPKRQWVFDNDETGIRKSIEWAEYGEKVFCWPKAWKRYKDINDISRYKKLTFEQIDTIISQNVFTGLLAITKIRMG